MDELFVRSVLSERVKLRPHELRRGYEKTILERLRSAQEGRCTRNGYIRRGSIVLHKVSEGRLDTNALNGSVHFVAIFECDAFTPVKGDTVTAAVRNFNRFGVMASAGIRDYSIPTANNDGPIIPVVSIIIPKQIASDNLQSSIDLNSVAVGDRLVTEIVGVKFELNDTRISILGRAVARLSQDVDENGRHSDSDISRRVDRRTSREDGHADGNSTRGHTTGEGGQGNVKGSRGTKHDDDIWKGDEIYAAEEDGDDPEEAAGTSVAAALHDDDVDIDVDVDVDDDIEDDDDATIGHKNKDMNKNRGSVRRRNSKGEKHEYDNDEDDEEYEEEEDDEEYEEEDDEDDKDENEGAGGYTASSSSAVVVGPNNRNSDGRYSVEIERPEARAGGKDAGRGGTKRVRKIAERRSPLGRAGEENGRGAKGYDIGCSKTDVAAVKNQKNASEAPKVPGENEGIKAEGDTKWDADDTGNADEVDKVKDTEEKETEKSSIRRKQKTTAKKKRSVS